MIQTAGIVPAFNNASTLPRVIASLRAQQVDELIVIDDGSTDDTARVAEREGARLVSLGPNAGRGAARARACAETSAPLVLMCDATIELHPDFLARARVW